MADRLGWIRHFIAIFPCRLAAQVLAVVGLGVAQASLDKMIDMAGGRKSITAAPTLADPPYLQTDLAKAEAALSSARAFFYEVTEQAYATLATGDDLIDEAKALLHLASTNAAHVGADVTQAVYRFSGTTGIAQDHAIARHMQDVMIVQQHALLSDGTWQNAGKVLPGLPSVPGFP